MNEVANKLNIELCQLSNEDCLKFTFIDNFNEEEAKIAVEEWRTLFKSTKGEKTRLVWDCREMTGYEKKALKVWQHAMKDLKDQIDIVWLITNSPIIKTGAKLMSVFSKFTIKVVKSPEQIK